MAVARHVAFGVVVILAEGDADGHIQQMPDRAAAIDRRSQFGDVVDHLVLRIEQAARGENSAQRPANRLAHGEDDMRRGRAHAVAVPLRGNPPAPEHHERVGLGGAQRLAHRGRMAVMAGEADISDLGRRHFQCCGAPRGRDVGGRDQPADVAKPPGAERRLAPVCQRHQPVRRRRKVVHQGRGQLSSPCSWLSDLRRFLGNPITFRRALNHMAGGADKSIATKPSNNWFSDKKSPRHGTKRRCAAVSLLRDIGAPALPRSNQIEATLFDEGRSRY
jgi:hypothetical protein